MNIEHVRTEFPITEQYAFLNHAAVSTIHNRSARALQEHIAQMQSTPFDRLLEQVTALMSGFKEQIARLINARSPEEIVAMPNTATGINTAAVSLPLRAGDNVLVIDGDYPAMIYPWLNQANRGVLTKRVPQHAGGVDLNLLETRIDRHTRAIAVSSAMFATGFKNDIEAIGKLCNDRGIYFVVDAIQTLGAFPLDVQACRIDFLACGSQKWLLSPPGSGFLYCRQELIAELQLGAYVGASSVVDPYNFLDYNFTLHENAERFNLGTGNFLGMIGLNATLEMLHEIGSAAIAERILMLTDMLIGDLQERGYTILSNQQPQHRSGIVIVDVPEPQRAYEELLNANVITSVRGAGLRVAPHFYNTEADVLRVGEVLGKR